MLGQSFLKLGLVDEIRLMIAPVLLGDGLHLFGDSGAEQKWNLKSAVAYKNGFVELSYRRQSTDSRHELRQEGTVAGGRGFVAGLP